MFAKNVQKLRKRLISGFQPIALLVAAFPARRGAAGMEK